MIQAWMFMPLAWMILGSVLLLLELADGSFYIFLPTGIGAWLTAGVLKMQLTNTLFGQVWIDQWTDLAVVFALATGIAMILIRVYVRLRPKSDQGDINQY